MNNIRVSRRAHTQHTREEERRQGSGAVDSSSLGPGVISTADAAQTTRRGRQATRAPVCADGMYAGVCAVS